VSTVRDRHFHLLWIAALAGVTFFVGLSRGGWLGPDEPRYAGVARAMNESGDWVTPRLNGEPWFEKPILYYWLGAIGFKLFDTPEVAARAPSAVLAALVVFCTYCITRRRAGENAGFVSAMMLSTSVASIGFARAAATDMVFAAPLALALMCAVEAIFPLPVASDDSARHRAGWMWPAAMGACLGAATLAKGPAAVLLAGGSTVVWAAVTRRWRDAFRLLHPIAIAAFAIVALPWYMLCAQRNPEFVQVFLIEHNWQRFLTPVFQHVQPWWYYAPILLLGFFPWSGVLLLIAAQARDAAKSGGWRDSWLALPAAWIVLPLVFFSASQSKLPGYILPVFAPLAILGGAAWAANHSRAESRTEPRNPWLMRIAGASPGLLFAALAAAAGHWLNRLPAESRVASTPALISATILFAVLGLCSAFCGWKCKPGRAIFVSAFSVAFAVLAVVMYVLPRMDAQLSPRRAAEVAGEYSGGTREVRAFRLHRAWQYGLNFYLRREVPQWDASRSGSNGTIVVMPEKSLPEFSATGAQIVRTQRVSPQAVIVEVK